MTARRDRLGRMKSRRAYVAGTANVKPDAPREYRWKERRKRIYRRHHDMVRTNHCLASARGKASPSKPTPSGRSAPELAVDGRDIGRRLTHVVRLEFLGHLEGRGCLRRCQPRGQ